MTSDSDDELRDGRSTRWDPHRRERRLTIINAAIAAIEEYGPEALTAQIADSRLVMLNRCGHWAQLEHAREFNRIVTSFIGASFNETV